jgi:hypothetical protein
MILRVRENAALAMPLILTVARDNLGKGMMERFYILLE